jgi:hypothetical protein
VPPDKPVEKDYTGRVFDTLPWKKSPHWMQFLNRVYVKIGPLHPAIGTSYSLDVFPPQTMRLPWILSFEDGLSGQEYKFAWSGGAIDEDNIKPF